MSAKFTAQTKIRWNQLCFWLQLFKWMFSDAFSSTPRPSLRSCRRHVERGPVEAVLVQPGPRLRLHGRSVWFWSLIDASGSRMPDRWSDRWSDGCLKCIEMFWTDRYLSLKSLFNVSYHHVAPLPLDASFLVKSSCFSAALAQRSLTRKVSTSRSSIKIRSQEHLDISGPLAAFCLTISSSRHMLIECWWRTDRLPVHRVEKPSNLHTGFAPKPRNKSGKNSGQLATTNRWDQDG